MTVPQLVYNSIALRLLVPMGARGRLILPGVVPMLPYIGIWLVFSWRVLKVRMRSQLQLHIAFALCAIAALAKGLLGIGLPGLVLLLYLLLTWDWKKLRGDTIVMGVLNVVVIAFPWYHAMLIRHGLPFWNELMGDNHWRRLAIGRHGDNTGRFNYYIRELGYALMPWTAVAAAALPAALVRARPSTTRGKYLLFISIWMLVGYGLVTVSMTKFHHYILPAIPAIAILIGWFLDALLTGEIAALPAGAVMVLIGLPLLGLATWDLAATPQSAQRLLWLFDYDYINNAHGRAWPDLRYGGWICGFAIAGALATGLLAHARTRRWATLGLGLVAVGFTLFALDKFLMSLSPHWSQKHLLATFYQMRQPGDRLVAWQMYWRGETFYSENELYDPRLPREDKTVFLQDKNVENLQEWLRKHPGVRVFFVVERARLQTLQSLMVNPSAKESLHVVDETNNKFVLAVAQN